MAPAPPISPDHVFVNCPFDDEYTETFRALIFAIRACGFQPRSARELDDSGQPRIEKIYGLIKECRYGIHDLSRTEPDAVHHLPRFNMPLELGIFMGAKHYGAPIDLAVWRRKAPRQRLSAAALPFQFPEDEFDVLAGAEIVGGEIGAGARIKGVDEGRAVGIPYEQIKEGHD